LTIKIRNIYFIAIKIKTFAHNIAFRMYRNAEEDNKLTEDSDISSMVTTPRESSFLSLIALV